MTPEQVEAFRRDGFFEVRGLLTADELDMKMDFDDPRKYGLLGLGTAAAVVFDETTDIRMVLRNMTRFYSSESCGQCTQCREGTAWINKIVDRIERGAGNEEDLEILLDVAGKMEGQTICAFADAAAWPIQGMLRHFRGDFEKHVRQRKCPFPGSFEL